MRNSGRQETDANKIPNNFITPRNVSGSPREIEMRTAEEIKDA